MQSDALVPSPKDLFGKIGGFFRAQRETLAKMYVTDLFVFLLAGLVVRLRRWPGLGEIATETARFHAAVARFDTASRAAFNRAYAEARAPFLQEFWGARRDRVPAELLPELECLLKVTPDDILESFKPFHFGMVDDKLREALLGRDDPTSVELWREAQVADRGPFETIKLAAETAALRDLLARTTDLPPPVRKDIEDGLVASPHPRIVASRETGQWQGACGKLITQPELAFGRLRFRVVPATERHLGGTDHDRYNHLVKAFTQDPASILSLQTTMEEEVIRATVNCVAWREGRPADGTLEKEGFRTLFLLRQSTINSLCNAWDADELIRLLDTFGVDLAAPAVRVVERAGPLQGRPAYWYAYPAGEEMSLLVALHLRPQDPMFNAVFLVRGTVEEALAWLAERYYARVWKENHLELDDAPADIPRSVVAALQAEDAVKAVRGRQEEVRKFLADYADDQRQDH